MKARSNAVGPPQVSQFSESLYGVSHGGESFTVAFLPGRIALCGTPGHQFFLNNGNLPAARLHEAFATEESYMERAILHKETSTDQTKFLVSLETLLKEQIIDVHSKRQLREFIIKCDCPPRRIKEKLKAMGFGHILGRLDFERYPDELINTIRAMEKFVDGTRGKTEAPTKDETGSNRARAVVRSAPDRGPAQGS